MLTRSWQDLVFGYVLLFVLRSLWNTDVLICGTIARSTGDVCYYCNTQYRLFFPSDLAPCIWCIWCFWFWSCATMVCFMSNSTLHNGKRVFISCANDNLETLEYLGFCGLGRLSELFLNEVLDVLLQPGQIPPFRICVAACGVSLRTRPSSEEIEARTENNIVSALNGRQDFVVGHLAGEVDVRIDAEQHRATGPGADTDRADHRVLFFGLCVRDVDCMRVESNVSSGPPLAQCSCSRHNLSPSFSSSSVRIVAAS